MGLGISPCGGFPLGFGEPTAAGAPPTLTQCSREIDPATKDYSINASTKGFSRMTGTRQRVVLAITTAFQSSTVQRTWGIRTAPKMGWSFEQEQEASIREALRQMAEVERVIAIESITIERGSGGRSRATISWRDLTTGTIETEPVLL